MSDIVASTPTVVPAKAEVVYDKWFVLNFSFIGNLDRTQPMYLDVQLVKGRYIMDGENVVGYETNPAVQTNFRVANIFDPAVLASHPEIASLLPQFIPAIAAVGARLGVL